MDICWKTSRSRSESRFHEWSKAARILRCRSGTSRRSISRKSRLRLISTAISAGVSGRCQENQRHEESPAASLGPDGGSWRRGSSCRPSIQSPVVPGARFRAIAAHRSVTLEALSELKGIGPRKLEKYGSAAFQISSGGLVEMHHYLDLETGEVVMVTSEVTRYLEEPPTRNCPTGCSTNSRSWNRLRKGMAPVLVGGGTCAGPHRPPGLERVFVRGAERAGGEGVHQPDAPGQVADADGGGRGTGRGD